jgi:hypothetical protein
MKLLLPTKFFTPQYEYSQNPPKGELPNPVYEDVRRYERLRIPRSERLMRIGNFKNELRLSRKPG